MLHNYINTVCINLLVYYLRQLSDSQKHAKLYSGLLGDIATSLIASLVLFLAFGYSFSLFLSHISFPFPCFFLLLLGDYGYG